MNRPVYGKTWWGQQWLKALTQIDHDNRLPRGRSYANKGAVRNLTVDGGRISAKVQGSRPRPYDVDIAVPPIASANAQRMLDRIAADPALIARLLNRELDPLVLDEARRLGIAVFPSRWSDLRMRCSCPDWAVPCKHLAAVIYLLSQEIDGDPFIVFSLRGLDLAAALKSRDIHIENAAAASLPSAVDVLFADSAGRAPEPSDPAALDRLDFSAIAGLIDPLWRVLPANPVFFSGGDLREIAHKVITRIARRARLALEAGAAAEPVATLAFSTSDRPCFVFDDLGRVTLTGMAQPITLAVLLDELAELPPARLPDLQPALAAMHPVRLLALHLLAKGAVVPQVFAADANTVGLRWLPALLDTTVRGLVEQLAAGLPENMVVRGKGRKTQAVAAFAQALILCAMLLDHFIHAWSEIAQDKPQGVLALFFGNGRARFDGPGEGAMAGSIQAWLSRLHLARRTHRPVLQLEENESGAGDFALSLAVARVAEADALAPPVPLSTVLAAPSWAKSRFEVLQTVAVLAEFHPPLDAYVRSGAGRAMTMRSTELPAFLFETLPIVRLLGIRALLPRALERLLRPRLSMQVKASSESVESFLKSSDIFSFDWKIAIGDELIGRAEFARLVGKATGIVRFKGEYVYLDPAEIERLRAQLDKPAKIGSAELMRVALAGEYAGAAVLLDAAAQRLVRQLAEAGDVPVPDGLRATLRPYQQRGYAWLYRNARLGLGSVIADDMGLGKTVQVLAALLRLKHEGALDNGRALVIVPTSLLTNWQQEAARFAPALSVAIFHGAKRELGKVRPDVLLTTYGVARSEAALLRAMTWRIVVVDEAQNIKNPAAAQTRAVKSIVASSFIAMSGTPVENRLSEYWSIMDFAQRGYLGSLAHFAGEYATPIQTHRDALVASRFRKVTAPFLLRRLKSDKSIIDDLPDKVEQDQICVLSKTQAALYESVVREGLKSIAGESDTFQRQGLVLQMILALKQVCNHPAQYLKQGGEDPLLSGKVGRFLDLVEDIHAAQEKVLVFTQFRAMGELLVGWLRERAGREPLFLHGGVARAKRDRLVERFQNDRTERVFILSLKAGGTGLNLTAASQVIHFDLWWNPAVEAQATDRAYRIGQQRNVQVHRFITRGTFEERINQMIKAKRELAELTVGSGETWIGRLPAEELRALFRLG